ncbi:MAG: hypothetical protein HYR96_15010 [Deltaproteobacteria bacterium]|nr:hypothetical protein [Deltaproteobacteria bacterium]MBI3293680.1 hypothetical protein [Deltaproteobacteria bacterium]
MRYIIRRSKPEDLGELQSRFPGLSEKLGPAGENFRRTVADTISPMRSVNYRFMAHKVGTTWQWICPSIELVGETETDLLALTQTFGVDRTALRHISQ